MSQDNKVRALMRRLMIAEEGTYPEYRRFCCGYGSHIESPTLVLREDGTGEVEVDCLCGSPETPSIAHAVYLPGFRSGQELAEWLLTNGADSMLDQWKTAAETNPAAISGAVRALQNLANPNRRNSRSARYWHFQPVELLELMGWAAGDPPLRAEEVERVMEFVGWRNNLDIPRPRQWARWTQEANSIAKEREDQTRHPKCLRLALDPGASPAQWLALLAEGERWIAAAVLRNPTAPDELRARAALLLSAPASDPDGKEVPF